jgi:hypothetical protein
LVPGKFPTLAVLVSAHLFDPAVIEEYPKRGSERSAPELEYILQKAEQVGGDQG